MDGTTIGGILNAAPSSALVICNVQRNFCDPEFPVSLHMQDRTPLARAAEKIAQFSDTIDGNEIPKILLIQRDKGRDPFGARKPHLLNPDQMSAVISHQCYTNPFSNPRLDDFLREQNVGHMNVVGVATSGIVLDTALQGLARGYRASIIAPLTGDFARPTEHIGSGDVFYHSSFITPRQIPLLREVIWRGHADAISERTADLDNRLIAVAGQSFASDRIIYAYQANNAEEANQLAGRLTSSETLRAYTVANHSVTNVIKGIDQVNVIPADGKHAVLVAMTDHSDVQATVERIAGRPHSHVLVPGLI
jgi:nicotinamidase-related amidase